MHFFVTVLVPRKTKDIEAAVSKALKKHEGAKWDWFQIGGRWTGTYDDYDPCKDPENWTTCDICGGTGERRDEVAIVNGFKPGYCNGCSGDKEHGCPPGKKVLWPTEWKTRSQNIASIEVAETKECPYAIVTPDGKWHEANVGYRDYGKPSPEQWEKKKDAAEKEWEKKTVPALFKEYMEFLAVIVDCHN